MRRFRVPRARRGTPAPAVALLALIGLFLLAPTRALADLPPGGFVPAPVTEGGTVRWAPVGVESSYELAVSTAPRGSDERVTVHKQLPRTQTEQQEYTPHVPAGDTVYVEVSADQGQLWSHAAIVTGAEAPVSSGEAAVGDEAGEAEAQVEEAAQGEEEAEGRAPPSLGATALSATHGAASRAPGAPASASTQAFFAPAQPEAGEPSEVTAQAFSPTPPVIGIVDGAGWGSEVAGTIVKRHITWDRVDILGWSLAVKTSLAAGFKVLAVVNNTEDGKPLSQIDPNSWGAGVVSELKAHPGVSLAEASNEAYLKGGVANPVQYGRMYLAAVSAMKSAGIQVPLLFNMTGDYPRGSWASPTGWSEDAHGGGWLRDAVNGVPGLAAAILANGISIHPYGGLGENQHDDYGVNAAAADEAVARTVLGSTPPFYITEFGFDLRRCGQGVGACTKKEQAKKLTAAYSSFLADPHVQGIWWYVSHDDSTGAWGVVNDSGRGRPSLKALSRIAVAAGQ